MRAEGSRPLEAPTLRPPFERKDSSLSTAKPRCAARSSEAPFVIPFNSLHLTLSLLILLFLGAEGRSYHYPYLDDSEDANGRITCYTCVNVSNNYECNRYAIDRPCPEGGDYCLTLHIMDGLDPERSVLVNKRCASLDDCSGDSTGCITTYGQTQCVSCCDQPYCNDSVPHNKTTAVFQRSSGGAGRWRGGLAWCVATAVVMATFGGPS